MDATLPLWEVVARSARAASHNDSRFSPVEPDEMTEITVEVSVLTEPHDVASPEDVVVGRHGVILSHEGRQALLLPQAATEHGWNREALLSYACRKAGLSVHAWKQGAKIQVFEAQVFQAEPGATAINGGP
jgi:AmmeMemoRadiSam system protein A